LGFDGDDRLLGFAVKTRSTEARVATPLTANRQRHVLLDSVNDGIVETSTGGSADRALRATTVSHALASYVENLYAEGWGAISLTGNTSEHYLWQQRRKQNNAASAAIPEGVAQAETPSYSSTSCLS
jgi:hypothetical protein